MATPHVAGACTLMLSWSPRSDPGRIRGRATFGCSSLLHRHWHVFPGDASNLARALGEVMAFWVNLDLQFGDGTRPARALT